MPVISIDGRAVEYQRHGSGSPVVFSSPTWWPLAAWELSGFPDIEHAHDAIAFNHRGIGASDETGGAYTVASMADDLVSFATALGLDSVHVVGYAIGAAVALAAARRHPGVIRSLVLAAPSGGVPMSAAPPELDVMRDVDVFGFEAHIRAYPIDSVAPAFAHDKPRDVEKLSAALWSGQGTLETFLAHVRARRGYAAEEIARGLDLPALVIVGGEDTTVRGPRSAVATAQMIAGLLPNAALIVADGVGHMPFWEAPALWDDVLRFLDV